MRKFLLAITLTTMASLPVFANERVVTLEGADAITVLGDGKVIASSIINPLKETTGVYVFYNETLYVCELRSGDKSHEARKFWISVKCYAEVN